MNEMSAVRQTHAGSRNTSTPKVKCRTRVRSDRRPMDFEQGRDRDFTAAPFASWMTHSRSLTGP